jgi:hypothetical protein
LTEADDKMEINIDSDSEGSAPIPNNVNANSDSSEVGSDDDYVMDTPTLPVNAHSVSGFYVSADAQSRTKWVNNMNFLDTNYTVPDPLQVSKVPAC